MLHRERQETRNARTVRILSDVGLFGYRLTARTARASPKRADFCGPSARHPRSALDQVGDHPDIFRTTATNYKRHAVTCRL